MMIKFRNKFSAQGFENCMPALDWIPLLSFLAITTLSPGPNNLSCASMGVQHGYRKSVDYIIGITVGLFILMLVIGILSSALLTFFPKFENILRYGGAAYILWLAYTTLSASYANNGEDCKPLKFRDGFILQYLNPKAMLFGLTLYTTYLLPLAGMTLWLVFSALLLGFRAYLINSSWVLFGSAVKTRLAQPAIGKAFNILLALMLVYNAINLIRLPELIGKLF